MTAGRNSTSGLTEFQPDELDQLLAGSTHHSPAAPRASPSPVRMPVVDGRQQRPSDSDEQIALILDDSTRDLPSDDERRQDAIRARRHRMAMTKAKLQLSRIRKPLEGEPSKELIRINQQLDKASPADMTSVCQLIERLGETESAFAVPAIEQRLERHQADIRLACGNALARIPSPHAAILLLDLLSDKNQTLVSVALQGLLSHHGNEILECLVEIGSASILVGSLLKDCASGLEIETRRELQPQLTALWNHSDLEIAVFAIGLSSRLSADSIVDDLQPLLTSTNPRIRCAVIETIAASREKKAVRFLNVALSDPDPRVRIAGAQGLQLNHSPRSAQRLLELMRDPNTEVRRAAAKTLACIDLGVKETHTREERNTAAFSAMDNTAIARRLVSLIKLETEPQIAGLLLEASGRTGSPECLPVLEHHLLHSSNAIRETAATAICRIGTDSGTALILSLLDDTNPEIRRGAVDAVGRTRIQGAQKRIAVTLNSDPSAEVRAAAARAVGQLGGRHAVTALKDALLDDHIVQCQAIVALGRLKNTSVVPFLRQQLNAVRPEILSLTCTALADAHATEAISDILALTDHSNLMVQRAAGNALKKLGYQRTWLREFNRRRFQPALRALACFAPSHLMGLIRTQGRGIGLALLVLLLAGAGYQYFVPTSGSSSAASPAVSLVRAAAISDDGNSAILLRKFGVAELWDVRTGQLQQRIGSVPKSASHCAFSGNRAVFFSAHEVAFWDLVSDPGGQQLKSVSRDATTGNLLQVVSARDSSRFFALYSNGNVDVLETETASVVHSFTTDVKQAVGISVSADGRLFAVSDRNTMIAWFRGETGEQVEWIGVDALTDNKKLLGSTVTAISRTGTYLAVANGRNGIAVIDLSKQTLAATIAQPFPNDIRSLNFAGSEDRLTASDSQGRFATFTASVFAEGKEFQIDLPESAGVFAFGSAASVCLIAMDDCLDATIVDMAAGTVKHQLVP